MGKSITETLRKINIEISGGIFYSIFIFLLVLDIFIGFKIYLNHKNKDQDKLQYVKESVYSLNPESNQNNSFKIYASKKGKKYYFSNCKSSIKEENKIYFNSEKEAQDAGYFLSKSCK